MHHTSGRYRWNEVMGLWTEVCALVMLAYSCALAMLAYSCTLVMLAYRSTPLIYRPHNSEGLSSVLAFTMPESGGFYMLRHNYANLGIER